MDIHCQRCGRVYEFDAARIPHKGLPVKCASCAHVFRVYRPTKTGDAGDAEWKVKQTDGTTYHFRELTTLQRWIVEEKVERRDEISKTGTHWKSLGDIAELSMFFKAVEGRSPISSEPVDTISDDEISVREQPNWSDTAEEEEQPVQENTQSEFIPPAHLAEEPEKKSYRKYIYLSIAGLVLGTSLSLAYIQGAFKSIGDEIPETEDEDQKKPIVEKIQLLNSLRSDPSRAVKALIGLLVALFAVGSLIGHYAREGFYISFEIRENVDLTESQVVIFKGTKGGVLWFQPTVERWTSILGLDLTEDQRTKIEKGIDFRTVNEAQKYLDGILDENTSAEDASD